MRNTASLLRRIVFVTIVAAPFLHIPSGAQEADLTARARQALVVLFDALRSGDASQVGPLLAPEFQVIRSDGGAYNKQQYLQHSLPKIQRPPRFDDLVVTQNADIVVTRMKLHIEGQIDGKQAESGAPQLNCISHHASRMGGRGNRQFRTPDARTGKAVVSLDTKPTGPLLLTTPLRPA